MNPETLNTAYETITNPILRLMIYFLTGAVATLSGAIVWLYRERQELQREMLAMNRENITALNNTADALEDLQKVLKP